ncbi:unnamed protein product [Symbiodinium necroappetens]|uniref:Uncharacterized protein n=1 Tax=Symbiodinium necroappetens TaxID=1628268 RepID=A0A813CAF3_9DINO|nr:unnamed protein product [Symbiodinium necroappetens]
MAGKRHAVLLTVVSSAIVMARPFDSRIWVHPFIPAPETPKRVAVRGARVCSRDKGLPAAFFQNLQVPKAGSEKMLPYFHVSACTSPFHGSWIGRLPRRSLFGGWGGLRGSDGSALPGIVKLTLDDDPLQDSHRAGHFAAEGLRQSEGDQRPHSQGRSDTMGQGAASYAPGRAQAMHRACFEFRMVNVQIMSFDCSLTVRKGPEDEVHSSMSKHPAGPAERASPQKSTASGLQSTVQSSKDPGCVEDHASHQTASIWAFCLCSSVCGGIAAWCVQRMFQRYQVDLAQFRQIDVFLIGTGLAFAAFGWLDDRCTSPDYLLHVIQQGMAAGAGGFYFMANQLRQRPRQA